MLGYIINECGVKKRCERERNKKKTRIVSQIAQEHPRPTLLIISLETVQTGIILLPAHQSFISIGAAI